MYSLQGNLGKGRLEEEQVVWVSKAFHCKDAVSLMYTFTKRVPLRLPQNVSFLNVWSE